MLRALTGLVRRGIERAVQLTFDLEPAPPRTAAELLQRLRALGLERIDRCRLTRNRAVMVSFSGRELRIHEGYLGAPREVLVAIVDFIQGRTRAERAAARRALLGFRIETRAPSKPRPRERTHADDATMAARLADWHARLNERHFGGRLRAVPIRVSRRMRSRLGHYTAATPAGEPAEIAISRRHIRRHGWEEALHTLLHEMVHQWQDEHGHDIDHGRSFRAKAREVGIAPTACRAVGDREPAPGITAVTRRAAREA